jgi:RNA polymerase sigma factor (TIGR02999 family)
MEVAMSDLQQAGLDQMWSVVHADLRKSAHQRLALERPGHAFSTTDLVHETYLRLTAQREVDWANRAQFFALAARSMRRILVDYARRHRRMRDAIQYDSSGAVRLAGAERADELLALDEALDQLAQRDERLGRVVECRFFAGYSEEETAEILGVTARTVRRDWTKAKAFLYGVLQDRAE